MQPQKASRHHSMTIWQNWFQTKIRTDEKGHLVLMTETTHQEVLWSIHSTHKWNTDASAFTQQALLDRKAQAGIVQEQCVTSRPQSPILKASRQTIKKGTSELNDDITHTDLPEWSIWTLDAFFSGAPGAFSNLPSEISFFFPKVTLCCGGVSTKICVSVCTPVFENTLTELTLLAVC